MQSYLLEPNDIKKITGSTFYSRGRRYFTGGKVHGLTHNQSINSWRAVVTGTEDYEVRIFFFNDDDLEAKCECPAYNSFYSCKHIAAVLLAIRERALKESGITDEKTETYESQFLPIDRDHFSKRLTEAFMNQSQGQSALGERETLTVHYQLHIQSTMGKNVLGLEMKLGSNYLYVIKNIQELIDHVLVESPCSITNKFSYRPEEHQLAQSDKEIFGLLQQILIQEQFYKDSYWNHSVDRRRLILPPTFANSLLARLAERNSSLHELKSSYEEWELHEELPPLTIQVTKDEENFQLHLSDLKQYVYLSTYSLLYRNGHFYKISEQQKSIYENIMSVLPYRSNGNHTISRKFMEPVLSEVMPELEKIANVYYTQPVQETVIREPLTAEVYLDIHNGALTADLRFYYGQHLIRPFLAAEPEDDVLIQRKTAEENAIMYIIEASEFKFDGEHVHLTDEDEIFFFLAEQLPILKELADVYLSGAVNNMLKYSETELAPAVEMSEEGNWLDIAFSMEGITADDISEVMKAVIEKKRYYKLSEGALLALDSPAFDRFRRLADEFELDVDDIDHNHVQLAQARSLQVDEVLHTKKDERNIDFDALISRLRDPSVFDVSVPEHLNADMRDYQLTGFRWMKTLANYRFGGILADDMGLGKTLQSISFLLSEKQEGKMTDLALIVAPASLVYNWKKEIERFAPNLSVQAVSGDPETRQSLLDGSEKYDIIITSYPLLRQDITDYSDKKFHALILDEAQAIKNEQTKTAQATRSINAVHRFALSGTPIENSLNELWSIFRTIMPGFYTNKKKFLAMKPEKIARMTRPFILRRLKKDVLSELPDKIETTQYSELTTEQKQIYLAYLEKIQSEVKETIASKGFKRGKLEILAGLTRLRQICCHPGLFVENYQGDSGKLTQLKELVTELKEGCHRILIFSQFSSMLKILYQEMEGMGMETFYLDGSTKSEDRLAQVERFNEGEKDAFLISLKAGGTGLNLTGADTVILYDLWWNPAIEEQAAGRAHRIGQKKVVQVIRMLAEGTIEERIHQLQQKKRDLVDQIIQPGETMLTSLKEDEIRQLLDM
ncbi:Superfamily II DNA or RNA helicase, SNF2 family [Thalassobacillus cyri]|uniref:Superfamily II DNA or RNA helicase, SNF2 family n=1 Tax=Thalassobacillus cyri TaxID=571932 RepID=A0A1H4AYQ5_9BACI|nr:DEAD/DEAH box helicase [Thalassobacillus cyri]SEA40944.1 Superfamily II DNA or RNA helicase, SNF2 family [Thalassobacillus cyri]